MANTDYFYKEDHFGDLMILGIPFEFSRETKTYSINYCGIKYTIPKDLAINLHEWHLRDKESGRLSYPLVESWYNQLSEDDKNKVQRFDFNTQTTL